MAIVPYKVWEDMIRCKEEPIQKPRLPPNPNVSAMAHLQRDLSLVLNYQKLKNLNCMEKQCINLKQLIRKL